MALPDYELHELPNGDIDLAVPPSKYVCDFCRGEPVVSLYPCRDFSVPECQFNSRGAWAACRECNALVRQKNFTKLAILVSVIEGETQEERAFLVPFLRMIYLTFDSLRSGPTEEVTP